MSRPGVFADLSFDDALVRASSEGKLLLIDFTAAWCAPCKHMDETAWRAKAVEAWVAQHAIAIQVDVDEQPAPAERFTIQAMPTMVLLRDGRELDRTTGGRSEVKLLEWLEGARAGKTEVETQLSSLDAADVSARLQLSQMLRTRGRHAEALEHLEYLWLHALEHEPAWYGVKHSFLAMAIGALVAEFAPAKGRFAVLRDALAARLPERESFHDWCTLNRVLGDEAATLAWFDGVKADPPEALKLEFDHTITELLREHERWADLGRLYRAPIDQLTRGHELLQEVARHDEDQDTVRYFRDKFRSDAAAVIRALRAAGRDGEVAGFRAEAVRLDPSSDMRAALEVT